MGARILIVEDDPDTLRLMELTLKTAGHEVGLASRGKECLSLIRAESFDLILLDIMMPDISGFDVLRELRADEVPLPPVVILTARNRPEDQEIGLGLGAHSYLIKPITRGKLVDVINEALGGE
ncbi:MAG: response regulator [Anaerolineales bacterium]|nr:response regulator [Anaerolineales bacterium]